MVTPRIAVVFAALALARLAAAPAPDPLAHAAIAAALAEHAPGVGLRTVALDGERLIVDLGGEARALIPGSAMFALLTKHVQFAAGEALRERLSAIEFEFRIAGTPLPVLIGELHGGPARAAAAPAAPRGPAPARAALNGRRIALSPGHGYYLNAAGRYVLQRSFFSGIVEDAVNHDFVTLIAAQLAGWGADVRPLRQLDREAGDGESGFPRWQEAARYHAKALGAAESVWNEPGFTHLDQDIRCRPLFANALGAELLVSIHNNGGGGTGTETLYDTNHVAAAESRRLADLLHARVIGAIRRDYDPNWRDRLVKGFNGSYGENRLATRPAVIIEIAFMDQPTPDNVALRDERFKRLVSTAIADGIREFVEGPVPAPPSGLAATNAVGGVTLTWTDHATNETGYRVQRREPAAEAWTTIATLAAGTTTYRDSTVTGAEAHGYRVQAFNAAGVSGQSSNEVTLGAPTRDLTPGVGGDGPAAWLTNLSLRTSLEAGRNVIVGFVVRPPGKQLLVRAAGPALAAFGLTTAMADPRIELFNGAARLAQNNDWPAGLAPAFSSLGAFSFPAASRDAAVLQSIAGAGTAVVTGSAGGVVLVEGYDAGTGSGVRLLNLSARNRVGTGADALIAGFVIAGTGTQRVLIRAVGPSLATFGVTGVLADPRLEVRDGAARIAENDNWEASLAPVFAQAGAFALAPGSRDAAVVLTLAAGRSYTVQVAGAGGATGEALVEVYEVP
ncbi:MAG: N-acetylmuramoyl-L-alanine amidase [Opitutaceae bacterium]|nr:N-acetylmuramoyl-L-alanine amidase [Opitutaceae bacterium]